MSPENKRVAWGAVLGFVGSLLLQQLARVQVLGDSQDALNREFGETVTEMRVDLSNNDWEAFKTRAKSFSLKMAQDHYPRRFQATTSMTSPAGGLASLAYLAKRDVDIFMNECGTVDLNGSDQKAEACKYFVEPLVAATLEQLESRLSLENIYKRVPWWRLFLE